MLNFQEIILENEEVRGRRFRGILNLHVFTCYLLYPESGGSKARLFFFLLLENNRTISIFSFYSSVQDRTIAIVWTRVWKAYRISHFPFCLVDLHLLQKKCLLLTVVVSLHDFKFDRRSIIIYNEIVKFAIYHQRPLEFSILENLAMYTWHDTPFIAKCHFKIFHRLNLHFRSSFP